MSVERKVLLVSPTPSLSIAVAPSLRQSGFCPMVAMSYQSAKLQLGERPEALVTELKLGEYNGLQLVLRSRVAGVRTIVVADKAFEAEVDQLGAIWMSPEAAVSGELPALITRLLETPAAETETSVWYEAPQDTPVLTDWPAYYASVVH